MPGCVCCSVLFLLCGVGWGQDDASLYAEDCPLCVCLHAPSAMLPWYAAGTYVCRVISLLATL